MISNNSNQYIRGLVLFQSLFPQGEKVWREGIFVIKACGRI